ncbi:hypothetical protein RDWZM_008061 [Blomia tropicalis]|uniref:PDZ and LIM domain protein Zasp n=1 Tax=Blomia tropicalis TaxID=40697 RepID=A0A9Q0M0Z8_BLOTA|nr:hypothetical protein RDWZM_008061 [Blomia tropicalis]
MANSQFVTVKLMRSGNETPWGFRLQGGAEFGAPLSVVKVANGSLAEQTGMLVGDVLLKINGKECDTIRHKEAQDAIISAGNYLELYLERGPMNTWRPSVTPVGDARPNSQQQVYTKTSLTKSPEKSTPIGSGHNTAAKPFNASNPPNLVHKQYNSPVNLYSEKNIEETLNAHSQVLATGATGINFLKPDAPINKESAVYQMVHDEEMRKSKGFSGTPEPKNGHIEHPQAPSNVVTKHVEAPFGKLNATNPVDNSNRNVCADCERLIVGVFVRINNKSYHAECFRCATCGTSLKNVGYFNINDKLYCDIHARQVKAVLGASAAIEASSASTMENNFTNGHANSNGFSPAPAPSQGPFTQSKPFNVAPAPAPAPAAFAPAPTPASMPTNAPIVTNPVSYHPPPQNGFSNISGMRKYSPVAPPTAPKPNFNQTANRNSMYNPSSFTMESHSSGDAVCQPSWSAPPSNPNITQNVVTCKNDQTKAYRQTVQHHERPKSCFNLPAYSVTSNTCTTTTNYGPSNGPSNVKLQFPKTATFASSTQTTTQKVMTVPPPSSGTMQQHNAANMLPQTNYTTPNAARPWTGSMPQSNQGNKAVTDARSAPKRGRGLLQSQLSGGVIPYCGYCNQAIRYSIVFSIICFTYSLHFDSGQYIMALNKSWCPNHFVCANTMCKRSLEENGFVEEQGRLYCETCYETHFAPACAKCNQRIKGVSKITQSL